MIEVGATYCKQGCRIVVHEIRNDRVYFQRWLPGVESQSAWANMYRMPIALFEEHIKDAEIETAGSFILDTSPDSM